MTSRLNHLSRACAWLSYADDALRIGPVRSMILLDAATALRDAEEPALAVLADAAATSLSADAGIADLLQTVRTMLENYSTDPRDPDYSRPGIFTYHNCWKCKDGTRLDLCPTPDRPGNCGHPHARND